MRKHEEDECGLGPAFNVIGGKWKAVILWEIDSGPRRFGELKRLVAGISEKVLIQQLREMEADGIIRREAYPEIPPKVVYSTTELGSALNRAMTPLADWGKEYAASQRSG